MKIRLASKKQIKEAYQRKKIQNKIKVQEELGLENIEKVPKELFQIIGETLSFIENINNMEEENHEDK